MQLSIYINDNLDDPSGVEPILFAATACMDAVRYSSTNEVDYLRGEQIDFFGAENGNLRLSQPHKMLLLELMHAVYQAETQESDLIKG